MDETFFVLCWQTPIDKLFHYESCQLLDGCVSFT